ncbi:MAG: hypothetical protein FJZ63_02945, partial [Chlamydiae bacterium]|nr:hypothetical protein [Chlamydiota bacterium]
MKKSLLSLFLCLASCAFSASEEDPTPEELASLAPFLPTSNTYFKVDLSLVLQGIGVGKRLRNEDNTQAHDISFNLKTNPALLAYRRENTHTLTLISSLEYALLYYKPAKKNAKFLRYTGADLEAGLF